MANVQKLNYTRGADVSTNPDLWSSIWILVCALIQAGWVVKASSNGTTKVAPADISTQNFCTLANVGSGGTAPSVTALALGTFATITGVAGLVAPTSSSPGSEGNFITFTGFASSGNNGTFQIVEVLSATSCRIRNTAAVASDANNGSGGVAWQEKSVFTTAYVQATWTSKAPWIVLAGARRVKIPLSSNPTGFLPGEEVTQGTGSTQRKGRLQGVVYGASSGWMVIDPYGDNAWDNATDIVGVTSGATLAFASIPTTPLVYQVELLIAKSASTYYTGSIYWLAVDPANETAQLLSAVAATSDATASSPPGFTAAAAASLPSRGIVMCGTTKAAVPSQAGAHADFGTTTNTLYGSRSQAVLANALPRLDRAVDGSWWLFAHSNTTDTMRTGFGWQQVDDCELGDLAPYASWANSDSTGASYATFNRQRLVPTTSDVGQNAFGGNSSAPHGNWRGYAARGCPQATRDIVVPFHINVSMLAVSGADGVLQTPTNAARVTNHPDASPPLRRESPLLTHDGSSTLADGNTNGVKVMKGRPRWLTTAGNGGLLTTYSLEWFAIIDQSSTTRRAYIVGPSDGTTIIASS